MFHNPEKFVLPRKKFRKEKAVNIQWNAEKYTKDFEFVHQYGEAVLDLIDAPKESLVADLGCGNGALSEKIAQRGYRVIGIDASNEMIETARRLHPEILFEISDALEFQLSEKADVIFSNAVFHWIDADKQDQLVENISAQIKEGGYLVCEFGGKGCAEQVHASLEQIFKKHGKTYQRTFYFPTIGEYAQILERHDLYPEYAVLFDRPTEQKTENGLEDWIRMFDRKPFEGIDEKEKSEIIREAEQDLKPVLFHNGKWYIYYVRIRIKARKRKMR